MWRGKMRNLLPLVVFLSFVVACSYGSGRMRVDIFNPAAELYDKGMEAYQSGDKEKAIQYFRDIVEYYPKNGLADDALLMLARCYEEEGEYYSALAYYKLFLYRFPTHKKKDFVVKKVKELEKRLGIKEKKGEEKDGSSRNSGNPAGDRLSFSFGVCGKGS